MNFEIENVVEENVSDEALELAAGGQATNACCFRSMGWTD